MSLRYVILHHTQVADPHFDLMFETLPGSKLATWRSPAWPIESVTTCTRLNDHRRDYLDYQGEIPGGRGWVTRIAEGSFDLKIAAEALWVVCLLDPVQRVLQLRRVAADNWTAELLSKA